MHVLIVDDEPAATELIARQLRGWSCEPASAESVDEAIRVLGDGSFDLVLSDVNMPRRNGFELLEVVRDTWPDTAMILMSGLSTSEMEKRAVEAGAIAFLPKPLSRDVLREALEGLPKAFP